MISRISIYHWTTIAYFQLNSFFWKKRNKMHTPNFSRPYSRNNSWTTIHNIVDSTNICISIPINLLTFPRPTQLATHPSSTPSPYITLILQASPTNTPHTPTWAYKTHHLLGAIPNWGTKNECLTIQGLKWITLRNWCAWICIVEYILDHTCV